METYPRCFQTGKDFKAWVEMSKDDGLPDPRFSFCNYCSKTYQQIMIDLDKCDNPTFEINEEDDGEYQISFLEEIDGRD